MNAGELAGYIERYLEADESGNGATNGSTVSVDSGTRQQLQTVAQKTDQLRQDTNALQKDVAAIKNNVQMAAILPLLLNQSLKVVKDSGLILSAGETIEFQQADPLTTMLPVLLMGGLGESGNGGTDSSSNMLLLALAVSGKL